MKLGLWFASLIPGFTKKVLAALGMSVVSITGLQVIWGSMQDQIMSNIGALPSATMGLLGLAGFGQALSYILGAVAARIALSALVNSSRIIGTSS